MWRSKFYSIWKFQHFVLSRSVRGLIRSFTTEKVNMVCSPLSPACKTKLWVGNYFLSCEFEKFEGHDFFAFKSENYPRGPKNESVDLQIARRIYRVFRSGLTFLRSCLTWDLNFSVHSGRGACISFSLKVVMPSVKKISKPLGSWSHFKGTVKHRQLYN